MQYDYPAYQIFFHRECVSNTLKTRRVMKEFNTTAICIPSKHYMVDLTEKVIEIKKLVDAGKYFTINRARQHGKTTTLTALGKHLSNEY